MSSVSLINGHIDDDVPRMTPQEAIEFIMTDAEIIKVLECIASKENVLCDSCPNKKLHLLECHRQGAKNALDLINRQKAEIEKLKEPVSLVVNCDVSEDILKTLRNQKVINLSNDEAEAICIWDKHVRAEATKEFAERLKEEACGNDLYDRSGRPVKAVTIADIDNVKKEMWG
ncbi:MAG: hypothetical protein J6Q61_06680 [Bacteroidales bacterium]|nr:hypothetical protein [Bacteroidales bacterium]